MSCVTLRQDYKAAWGDLWATLKPYADRNELIGVFLGDERIWNGASLANVSTIAATIRSDWPDAIICARATGARCASSGPSKTHTRV